MARFTFALETVLRQRKNAEHIAQREAAIAQQALVDLQARLQKLDREAKAVGDQMRNNHLVGQIDLGVIASHRRYMVAMERTAIDLARGIAAAQVKADQARAVLTAAARDHKVIATLKERQWEEWLARENRREAEILDEAGMQIAFNNLTEDVSEMESQS